VKANITTPPLRLVCAAETRALTVLDMSMVMVMGPTPPDGSERTGRADGIGMNIADEDGAFLTEFGKALREF